MTLVALIGVFLLGGLVALAIEGYILRTRYSVQKKLEYRWNCHRCSQKGSTIAFSSSSWEHLMQMADDHIMIHNAGGEHE